MKKEIITIITILSVSACYDSSISEACNDWCDAAYARELEIDIADADAYAEDLESEIVRLENKISAQKNGETSCLVNAADVCESELSECAGHVALLGEQYTQCRDEKIRLQKHIESGCAKW